MTAKLASSPLRYLNAAQVAERFGVSMMTVYRMARRGEIPARRVGKQYRFLESELNRAFFVEGGGVTIDDVEEG